MDPRWLEILKASGAQTFAIAVGCALILLADRMGLIPKLDTWMVQLATAMMIIAGLLAVASLASKTTFVYTKVVDSTKRRRALAYSIDTLNPDEIDFLKGQIRKGESTVQLHPFNAGGISNFVHQAGLFQGLQSKQIVDVSAADPQGKIQTITIRRAAWQLLKRKFREDA